MDNLSPHACLGPQLARESRIICLLTACPLVREILLGVVSLSAGPLAMHLADSPSPDTTCHIETCMDMRHFPLAFALLP